MTQQHDTATNRLRYFAIVNFVLLLNLNSAKKSFAVVLDFCNSRLSKWRRAFKPSIAITTSFNFIPAKQFLEVGEDYKQKKYEIKVKKRHNPRIIISCIKISCLKKTKGENFFLPQGIWYMAEPALLSEAGKSLAFLSFNTGPLLQSRLSFFEKEG